MSFNHDRIVHTDQYKFNLAVFLFIHRKGTFWDLTLFKNNNSKKSNIHHKLFPVQEFCFHLKEKEFNPNPHILFSRKSWVTWNHHTYDMLHLLWNWWAQAGRLRCSAWFPGCNHKNFQNTSAGASLWEFWLSCPRGAWVSEVFLCGWSFLLLSQLCICYLPFPRFFLSINCTV